MEISLNFDPEHFIEIYERSYSELLANAKKQFRNRFLVLTVVFIAILFIIYISTHNGYMGLAAFSLFIFSSVFIRYKTIGELKNKIESDRNKLDHWLEKHTKYNSFKILTTDTTIIVMLDNEEHPSLLDESWALHLFNDYIYIVHKSDETKNILLPKKSMSNHEFNSLSEFLKTKLDHYIS